MNQYNTLNVKLSNSHLNKLKSRRKNDTEVTLKFHQMLLVILIIKNNFSHKLLLINTQVSELRKTIHQLI